MLDTRRVPGSETDDVRLSKPVIVLAYYRTCGFLTMTSGGGRRDRIGRKREELGNLGLCTKSIVSSRSNGDDMKWENVIKRM